MTATPVTAPSPSPTAPTTRPPRRWSARALPSCLLMLLVLAVAGLVLADVIASRGADTDSWLLRHDAVRQWLQRQSADDVVAMAVSGALAVAGACVVAVALLPGQRDLLPMYSSDRLTIGYLSADSGAAALSATARNIDGVLTARARLGRRAARASFRVSATTRDEYDAAVATVDAALRRRFASLGLVRPEQLRVKPQRFRPRAQPAPTVPEPDVSPELAVPPKPAVSPETDMASATSVPPAVPPVTPPVTAAETTDRTDRS